MIEAAYRAMHAGQTHYTQVDGTPELKAAIVAKFKRENGIECKPENISAGAGGKQVLFNALMSTLDPGDEVLIPAPSWVAYADITHFCEGVPVWLPTRAEDGFKLRPEALERAITGNSKWLMLNSPSNPSGAVYTAEEYRARGGSRAPPLGVDHQRRHVRAQSVRRPHLRLLGGGGAAACGAHADGERRLEDFRHDRLAAGLRLRPQSKAIRAMSDVQDRAR